MVEAVTATALHTLRSTGFPPRKSVSLHSSLRLMKPLAATRLSADYFTPSARVAKGKERASENLAWSVERTRFWHASECSGSVKQTLWSPKRSRFLSPRVVPTFRTRPARKTSCQNHKHARRYSSSPSSQQPGSEKSAAAVTEKPKGSLAEQSRDTDTERPQDAATVETQDTDTVDPQGVETEGSHDLGPQLSHGTETERPQGTETEQPQDAEELQNTAAQSTETPQSSGQQEPGPWTERGPNDIILLRFLARASSRREARHWELQPAWDSYQAVKEAGLPVGPVVGLKFAERLISAAEDKYDDDPDALYLWGTRACQVLDSLQSSGITDTDSEALWRRKLLARGAALVGDLEQATAIVHTYLGVGTSHRLPLDSHASQMFDSIVKAIQRRSGPTAVLDFVLDEYRSFSQRLQSHLFRMDGVGFEREPPPGPKALRNSIFTSIAELEHPEEIVAERKTWPEARKRQMGELFIRVLCEDERPGDAYLVLHELETQVIPVHWTLRLQLVRALVQAEQFERANFVYSSVVSDVELSPNQNKYTWSTGLYLFAHQGDIARSESCFQQLQAISGVTAHNVALRLHAYAVLGKIDDVVSLFHEHFPDDAPTRPSIFVYTVVIYAHAQRGDFEGMNAWLDRLAKAGLTLDRHVYNTILKSFAMRSDMDSMATIMDQMRAVNLPPDNVSYNTVMSILARRKDPVAAEAIYRRAIAEGVVPSREMLHTLMNAHVEAGSWAGVIRVYDYMQSAPTRRLTTTIETFNTLLKAYVLIGAPFDIVSGTFSRLGRLQPNQYTYSLLLQSACDAGQMETAEEIFQQMEQLAGDWESSMHLNVYSMTILMAAYLRLGDRMNARKLYNRMRKQIQPSSVTYGTILTAYGNERTEESLEIAERFLHTLVEQEPSTRHWLQPGKGREAGLQTVYKPVMVVYAGLARREDVERLFQSMLDKGGEPTLGTLAALLDVYRRTDDVEAARQVWPQIFRAALEYTNIDALFAGAAKDVDLHPGKQRQTDILCIPLSIYVDVLSAAGYHAEVAAVWQEAKMKGFAFDSNNWNHLAVALLRAGEPERAFEVLEKVILKYQKQSHSVEEARNRVPPTPLSFDTVAPPPITEDSPSQETASGHLHGAKRRSRRVGRLTESRGSWLPYGETYEHDFAHPLHILQQISPAWNAWRPHRKTLETLYDTLIHLRAGHPIQAVPQRGASRAQDTETREEKTERATVSLNHILEEYPAAVQAVVQLQKALEAQGDRSVSSYR